MKKFNYLIAMAIAAFTFTSCEDVPEPFGQPINPNKEEIVIEPTGSGTEADPYNVAKVTEVTKAMADGDVKNDVYTKGYICQIDEIDITGNYGNSTYWISDDAEGKSGKYEVYRGVGLGGQKFNEAGATIIKVGDAVTIKGNIKNFKGTTPEYDQGSIIVELNGQKAGGGSGGGDTDETIGTKDAPLSIAQALEKINALEDGKESELNAYVKGKVVKVTTTQANFEKFGNLNYLISEDGTETNAITVYSGDGLDGAKFSGIDALGAGDEVIVFGKLYKYVKDSKVTPEIAKGNYLVSLVKAGSGGDTPTSKYGTAESPLTVAQAIALIDAESTIDEAFVKGKISQIDSYSSQYKSITYWISDDGGTTTQLEVYSGKGLNGADFAAKEDLTIGQTVTIKGKLKKYNDIYEFDKTSSIVSFGDGGGDTPTSKYGTADAPLTVAQAIALIDAESTIDEAFVKGKISQIDSYSSQYKSITYWISDDGGTTTQLEVYSGKGLNGADFAAKEDLTVGQTVTIKGKLKKYNAIYEFDKTSSIVSIQ